MTRHHHRTVTLAVTLALAAGFAATSAAQQSKPSAHATTGPCSEVCSGGGYVRAHSNTPPANHSVPTILRGTPAPCSEVCSDAGYGSPAAGPSYRGPRSEVISAGGYGSPHAAPAVTPVSVASHGFDWSYLAIGIGGVIVLLATALTAARITRNHRRRASRSPAHPTA